MDNGIGTIHAQDYVQQLCLSIIDDLENNNFSWYGNEQGIFLTINGQTKFISNNDDEEKEITELWNQAKNQPQQENTPSTSESNDSSET